MVPPGTFRINVVSNYPGVGKAELTGANVNCPEIAVLAEMIVP
jgi:hypothetical protein